MRVIKRPFVVIWGVMRTRRGRVVFATVASVAMFGSRARTVISRVPERSRSTIQGVTSEVRGLLRQENQDEPKPASVDGTERGQTSSPDTAPSGSGEAAETQASAQESAGEGTSNPAGDQPADQPAAPAGEEIETQPAGEDESGTFRPTRAEADDFGVVVTDDAPVGLAAGNWVKGDGTPNCPEEFPIKGNANSRIYHMPGEPSYERTIPELCFASEDDAAAAGYRPRSK